MRYILVLHECVDCCLSCSLVVLLHLPLNCTQMFLFHSMFDCTAQPVSPKFINGVCKQVVIVKGKGTKNDIDRQLAVESLPIPGTTSWLLIADMCLISAGLGTLDVSLFLLSLPARKLSPHQSPPITALIRGLISVNHCAFLLSFAAHCRHNSVTGLARMAMCHTEWGKIDKWERWFQEKQEDLENNKWLGFNSAW